MKQYVIGDKTLIDNIANNARLQTGDTETYTIQGLADAVARGGAVQSDWNENDESSKAYVKNRTHWIDENYEYVLYDGTYTFSEYPGLSSFFYNQVGQMVAYDNFEEGQYITFIFDGVDYSGALKLCSNDTLGTFFYYGNLIIMEPLYGSYIPEEEMVDTGEPFFWRLDAGMIVTQSGTEHTIVSSVIDQYTMQIPSEYIPLNIWRGTGEGSVIANNSEINKATKNYSFAEGFSTTASGNYSHAEGHYTTASGLASHAEGSGTTASNDSSHAEGHNTTASNFASHAEGYKTKASSSEAHAEGLDTIAASNAQHAQGKYNIENANQTYAHIIGNGTSDSARSNAHTLDWSGNAVFAGTVSGTGADYAEHFEWLDGNPDNEDRVGMVVTLEGDKIRKANANDEVLGIVSGTAMVIGDNAEWEWHDKFMADEYGRVITEMVEEFIEVRNPETNEVEYTSIGFFPHRKVNPEWDETKAYTRRSDRPEWDVIGLLGKLYVNDDGTCIVGGYATNADDGIVTASAEKTNMRVMKRVTDNIVIVFMK